MYIYPESIDKSGLAFDTDSRFVSIECGEVDFWYLRFTNGIDIGIEGGLWRLLEKRRVRRVSSDHQQKFGLPQPVDLVKEMEEVLAKAHLLQIKVDEDTGDLHLVFSDDLEIQALITSSGYESYSFSVNGKRYIGGGSGEMSVYTL